MRAEMARIFTGGDKVFAKVRGYPAWPARVESIADSSPSNTKYHVLFYGTMQRGICRSQEIFPYAENKEKYGKVIKRKGFKEALDQIEGLAPVPELVPKLVDQKYRNGFSNLLKNTMQIIINNNYTIDSPLSERKKIVKRKTNISKETKDDDKNCVAAINDKDVHYLSRVAIQKQKKKDSKMKRKQNPLKADDVISCLPDPGTETAHIPIVKATTEQKPTSKSAIKVQKKSVNFKKSMTFPSSHSNDVPLEESLMLSNVLYSKSSSLSSPVYVSQEKQSSPVYSKTISRSGRVIKRKSFHDEAEEIVTPKRKRIVHRKEEESVQNQLKKKNLLYETGQRETSLKKKQNWLATENCLTKLDTLVRSQLNIKRANPEQCIQYLDDIKKLDLKPLMLKKHPEVVETIKRLRKYVGNSTAWDFSEEQRIAFQEKASEIRKKAETIFEKFKSMFCSRDDIAFLKVFADCVISFQAKTHNWPLDKIYALTTEPKIKQPKKNSKSKAKG